MRYVIALLVGIGSLAPNLVAGQNVITTETKIQDVTVRTSKDPITDNSFTMVSLEGQNLMLAWGAKRRSGC